MLVGHFNAEDSGTCLSDVLFEVNAKNIVNNYGCCKSVKNRSCIDLVITNSRSASNTVTIITGLFDFQINGNYCSKNSLCKFDS